MSDKNYLAHVGRSKRNGAPGPGSGRYPLGSGEEPYQDYSKAQLKRMSGSNSSELTKAQLAKKVNKKKTNKSFASIARKRAEEFRKSRYKKQVAKEKAETKRYTEQIKLEKMRLDKEKAKAEAKRLSKMSGKDFDKEKKSSENDKEEKDYSIKAKPVSQMSNADIDAFLIRMKKEADYNRVVNPEKVNKGKQIVQDLLMEQGKSLGRDVLNMFGGKLKESIKKQIFEDDSKKYYGPSKKDFNKMTDKELDAYNSRMKRQTEAQRYRDGESGYNYKHKSIKDMTDAELEARNNRLKKEAQYKSYSQDDRIGKSNKSIKTMTTEAIKNEISRRRIEEQLEKLRSNDLDKKKKQK